MTHKNPLNKSARGIILSSLSNQEEEFQPLLTFQIVSSLHEVLYYHPPLIFHRLNLQWPVELLLWVLPAYCKEMLPGDQSRHFGTVWIFKNLWIILWIIITSTFDQYHTRNQNVNVISYKKKINTKIKSWHYNWNIKKRIRKCRQYC